MPRCHPPDRDGWCMGTFHLASELRRAFQPRTRPTCAMDASAASAPAIPPRLWPPPGSASPPRRHQTRAGRARQPGDGPSEERPAPSHGVHVRYPVRRRPSAIERPRITPPPAALPRVRARPGTPPPRADRVVVPAADLPDREPRGSPPAAVKDCIAQLVAVICRGSRARASASAARRPRTAATRPRRPWRQSGSSARH